MANERISNLNNADPLDGTEEFPIVQTGKPNTVKTTINAIATFFGFVKKGTLTTNYIQKATGTDTIGNSNITASSKNVGINTINPTATLEITGDNDNFNPIKTVSSNTALSRCSFTNNGAVDNDIELGNSNGSFYFGVKSSASGYLDNYTSQPFIYKISNVDKITISNTGNLAISNLTASQIVETDASKNLVSVAKQSGYNLPIGTTAGTILEGNRITQTITNGVTDKAPSEDAVHDALALKLSASNNLSDLANFITARNNLKEWDLKLTNGNQSTTSNVAINITDLVSPTLTANKRYKISGILHIGCNNTGGVKIQATLPTGATMWISLLGQDNANTTITRTAMTVSATLSVVSFCNFNSANSFVFINGEISIGANAGTVQFGFASNINTQTSTISQQGTSITIRQLD